VDLVVACAAFALAGAASRFAARPLRRPPAWSLRALAALAALGALAAPSDATGLEPLDAALRAGFAAAMTLAAAKARAGWALAAAAVTGAALVVADSTAEPLGWAALGLTLGLVLSGARLPEPTAIAGALLAQVLLRLDWPLATGASLGVGVVVAALVLAPGLARARRRTRRVVAWSVAGACVVCVAGSAAGIFTALDARPHVERGIDAAREGLAAFGGGEPERGRAALEEAAEAFAEAERATSSWWARSARGVPGVAQQARAVATLAGAGRDLAVVAVQTIDRSDLEAVRPRRGRVDLDAVRTLSGHLDAALSALVRAEDRLAAVDSPWLLAPLADRYDELVDRVVVARDDAETAATAARLTPALLGGDGPRRYFLAVQTPAEARGNGGFMGNWAEITAVDGRLELSRFGREPELSGAGADPAGRTLEGLDEYLARYGRDSLRYWGLVNFSPDFPTVATVMAQLYPQSGGERVDGVIAVDPYGLAALLEALGTVSVDGLDGRLDAGNAARFLLHEQYLLFDEGSNEDRVDLLGGTTRAVFDLLVGGGFDSPAALAAALGPAVDGRHLQLASIREDEQRFFDRIGAIGGVSPLRGDSVAFVGQNYAGNKIDWFLRREAAYEVDWDPATGSVRGVLEVRLRNDAPASGLPHSVIGWGGDVSAGQRPTADGENLMVLSMYSAVPAVEVTLDGEALSGSYQRELGRFVYSSEVSVPAGSVRTVRVVTEGAVPPGPVYRLDPFFQPMVTADRLDVSVRVADGWTIESVSDLEVAGPARATAAWTFDRGHAGEIVVRDSSEESLLDRLRGDG